MLRVAYARGVTPAKWARIWAERFPGVLLELTRTDADEQLSLLRDGLVELSFVRLPIDPSGIHLIPLYAEKPVVVVPRGHLIEAVDEVTLSDLDDEIKHPFDADIEASLELVAAGVGIVIVPQAVARLHARRDLVARPVSDAPSWQVGLAWRDAPGHPAAELIDDFVGVVRGRTANSSRGAGVAAPPTPKAPSQAKKAPKPATRAQGPRGARSRRRPTR